CFRSRTIWLSDSENQMVSRQGEQGVLTPSRTPAALSSAREATFFDSLFNARSICSGRFIL
ncbi:MAG: hypothetical protein J6J19_02755, partial [Oscillospiraceae bacterium]|nr:hypothetical protein [Oscillospiraceae bacterium]